MTTTKAPNRLIKEKSPYLLQHANNPVDWYSWGKEAFAKAKAERKPIFLSIGYSTCHWCHVMERESFEDEEVAAVLNERYVAIKVDREERPDVDSLYMNICHAMTGQGGWPLTIIMSPEKMPFFAGTYFPKHSQWGRPGLLDILGQIGEMWKEDSMKLSQAGQRAIEAIKEYSRNSGAGELDPHLLEKAYASLAKRFDTRHGGFGRAPKYPSPHNLFFLLRYGRSKAREGKGTDIEAAAIVEKTLEQMYKGGIFDHIGFGFARYSTDDKWLVPHFEKMLYDNALLSIAYLEAWQITKKPLFKEAAEQIFTYVLRDMTSPEGGFYSAEDADSEGVEGKFYLWTPAEIKEVLGEEQGGLYCAIYDITEQGNFEGKSIPNLIERDLTDTAFTEKKRLLEEGRQKLFAARMKRIPPHKDDKILTSWNALMIAALALGARILERKDYLAAAVRALDFICKNLVRPDGRLLARYREGEAAYEAYLDDYAFLVWALLELYQATYQPHYLQKALEQNEQMLELFRDEEQGGLFLTGEDAEELPLRPKDGHDGAIPSGNSVAAFNLLRLSRLTGEFKLEEKAQGIFSSLAKEVGQAPAGYTFLLLGLLYALSPRQEAVIVAGEDTKAAKTAQDMLQVLKQEFLPQTVSLYVSPENMEIKKLAPFLQEYATVDGKTAAYICENQSCHAPVTSAEELRELLAT